MEDFYETGYNPLTQRRGQDKKRTIKFVAIAVITLALILIALGIIGATAGNNPALVTPSPTIPSVQVLPTETPTPEVSPTPEDEGLTPTPKLTIAPTPTKSPSKTPTPSKTTPTPSNTSTERSNLSIEIQNGSGISGAAGQASALLKGLGYKVLSTGNADNFDYAQTVIKVKPEKKSFLSQLKLDVEAQYKVESATADLTGTTADALVIVGKE